MIVLPDLHARGRWPPPPGRLVAIVGSRRPTSYGEAVAEALALDLAIAGVGVVSGLAVGIDAAAHRGVLKAGGYTAAVLGSGLDLVYPAVNSELAAAIVESGGALLSQFAAGTRPQRGNFPRRNWTIATVAELVVVVEAAERSGALGTAAAALQLGRSVMAVPGSVFSALSVGTHQLLRDGAGLVQNARDVLSELGAALEVLDDPLRPPPSLAARPPSHPGADGLVRHLDDALSVPAAELARKLAVPIPEIMSRLTRLELDGWVRRLGSGYVRVHGRGTSRDRPG